MTTVVEFNGSATEVQSAAVATILDIIRQAETNHGFIAISGYRSENGRVANYVLQPYGSDAYHRLVRESLEMLENGEFVMPATLHGEIIPPLVWLDAIEEQKASFRKTLSGGHGRTDERVRIDKGFYAKDGVPYVANVRIVKYFETPEQKAENDKHRREIDKVPASAKAKAKAYLRENLPVGNYRGQFKLDPDKFERIAFSGISIDLSNFGNLFTPGK